MPLIVRRCMVCAATPIETRKAGRLVIVSCHPCGAQFIVEFDPPDAPGLRARIERLDVDEDGSEPLHPDLVHLRETMRRAQEMRRDAIGLRNAVRHWRMLRPLAERNRTIH